MSASAVGSLEDMLELLADAIIESRPQVLIARDSGLSEKHVSQMLTGKVDGSLKAWQRMLDAAGLAVTVSVTPAEGASGCGGDGGGL